MAAQTNPPTSFGYTWNFADNSRGGEMVELSPNINYTVSEVSVSRCNAILAVKIVKKKFKFKKVTAFNGFCCCKFKNSSGPLPAAV